MKRKGRKIHIAYPVIFACLFILAWIFPYTGDDWAWGSQIGLDRLATWFDNYSGRYFGNLMVLALTRSRLLRALAISAALGSILLLGKKITGKPSCATALMLLALVFMPPALLRQSIAWTAGFANYCTSAALTLVYLCYVNPPMCEIPPRSSVLHAIFLLVLGFANTLIVEHVTLYHVVLSLYVIVFVLAKYRKVCAQHITYLAGCVGGTVLMFSNRCYSSTLAGSDGYRSTALGGGLSGLIAKAKGNLYGVILEDALFQNVVVLVVIAVACTLVWSQVSKQLSRPQKRTNTLCLLAIVGYAAFAAILQCSGLPKDDRIKTLMLLATMVYLAALVLFVCTLPVPGTKKIKLLFFIGSVLVLTAPLLLISPIGSRCFFIHYVFLILFALELLSLLNKKNREGLTRLKPLLYTAVGVGFAFLLFIYGTIFLANERRVSQAMADAKTSSEITVMELPYPGYTWCSSLENEIWAERFKLFYGIDEDVRIVMTPYVPN